VPKFINGRSTKFVTRTWRKCELNKRILEMVKLKNSKKIFRIYFFQRKKKMMNWTKNFWGWKS